MKDFLSLIISNNRGFSNHIENKLNTYLPTSNTTGIVKSCNQLGRGVVRIVVFVPKIFQSISFTFYHLAATGKDLSKLEFKHAGKNLVGAVVSIPLGFLTAATDIVIPELNLGSKIENRQMAIIHNHDSNVGISNSTATLSEPARCPNIPAPPAITEHFTKTDQNLWIIQQAKKLTFYLKDSIGTNAKLSAETVFMMLDTRPIIKIYDEMIQEFSEDRYRKIEMAYYNQSEQETLRQTRVGKRIPGYFANASTNSSYYSKGLTLLGWRNQIAMAPIWIDQLQKRLFSSKGSDYESNEGLHAIKNYTGQTVHLDQSMTTYDRDQATMLIEGFRTQFRAFTIPSSRNIDLPLPYVAHAATDNHDKGNHPVWSYTSPSGETSYHVNVPNISDVVNALIETPLLFAECYLLINKHSRLSERQNRLDELYQAISIKCLDDKIESVTNFYKKLNRDFKITRSQEEIAREKYGKLVDSAIDRNALLRAAIRLPEEQDPFFKETRESLLNDSWLPPPNKHIFIDDWVETTYPKLIKKAKTLRLMGTLYQATEDEGYQLFSENNPDLFKRITREWGVYTMTSFGDEFGLHDKKPNPTSSFFSSLFG